MASDWTLRLQEQWKREDEEAAAKKKKGQAALHELILVLETFMAKAQQNPDERVGLLIAYTGLDKALAKACEK